MIDVAGQPTLVHDVGAGPPVVLLHGSGPGVSAVANWRLTMRPLAEAGNRVIAPDQLGFGKTVPPADHDYTIDSWVQHTLALLDSLSLERVSVVGNSFGGAIAIRLATRHPARVDKLALMGPVGVPFELTPALDAAWGYEPSVAAMKELLGLFAYDKSLVNDDLAELRYTASIADGADKRFAAMFPSPRQRWIDAMVTPDAEIAAAQAPTLIVHGREDEVIPLSTSQRLLALIGPAELHVFGRCGHWTQIERAADFNHLLIAFLARG